jgi:hypothetical protein
MSVRKIRSKGLAGSQAFSKDQSVCRSLNLESRAIGA